MAVYLGNKITVDSNKLTVNIDQTQYIDELIARFEMSDCNPVLTPVIQRLTGGRNCLLRIAKCTGTWLAVLFIWPAGLVLIFFFLQFQNFLVLYPHHDIFIRQR